MNDVRIQHWKALGGYYVVKGKNASPISGRFSTREEAKHWLKEQRELRRKTERWGVFEWTGSNRYPRENARAIYARQSSAERAAEKMNAQQPNGNFVARPFTIELKENPSERVTKKAVDTAATEWTRAITVYGSNSIQANRCFTRYMDLKKEWEMQNPGKKYGEASKRNPVPLAKGTKMKRKKTATKKRKFSAKQIAAQKRFAERARAGTLRKAAKKPARKVSARKSNPRIRYGYTEIVEQATQFAKLAKITVNLEKHGDERPLYQITSESGSPMSQMLTALQMRDWLHGAMAAALAIRERR